MIVKLLLNLIKAAILFIISLFPPLPDMSGLASSLGSVVSVFLTIDSFVSIRLFALCMGFLFIFSHLDMVWSVIMWVIRKIPGVS